MRRCRAIRRARANEIDSIISGHLHYRAVATGFTDDSEDGVELYEQLQHNFPPNSGQRLLI